MVQLFRPCPLSSIEVSFQPSQESPISKFGLLISLGTTHRDKKVFYAQLLVKHDQLEAIEYRPLSVMMTLEARNDRQ